MSMDGFVWFKGYISLTMIIIITIITIMDFYCYYCYVVAVVAEWLIALQPPHGEARGGDSV